MEGISLQNYQLTKYLLGSMSALLVIYLWRMMHKFWVRRAKYIEVGNKIPGPRGLPILGNAWDFARDIEDLFDVMCRFAKQYPIGRVWIASRLVIGVSYPEHIEIVMKSPKATEKTYGYHFLGMENSILSGHGAEMQAHRRILVPMINGKCLSKYIETFNIQIHRFIDTLASRVNMGEFDICDVLQYCVSDIAFETILGIPAYGQSHGDVALLHALEILADTTFRRIVSPWLHPSFIFNLTQCGREWKTASTTINEFLAGIIDAKKKFYLALTQGDHDVAEPKLSILDLCIKNSLETNTMNDREILCHFMSLLIAYGDTILHLSSFTMLMLAMHPDIQETVRSEVMKVVGTEGNIFEENIGQLIYTEMVLKETIRLFPTGALLTRDASDDFEIDGFLVPKGATIAMIPPLTHRLKSHWDEPDKFIPERFSTGNSKNRHPYLYIPFSGGSRSCAGSKYGMACLKVIVAHVIRKYQLMTNMKFEGLKLRTHISVHSRNGYKISIKEIERS